MKALLLAIFCFFVPGSSSCSPTSSTTSTPTVPTAVSVRPTIAMTYSPIFTTKPLSVGSHTFSVWVKSSQPVVGYQFILALAGAISNLTLNQHSLASLRNLPSQSTANQISFASIISDPLTGFKPTTAREIAQVSFTVDQPNTVVSFSLGAPFSKMLLFDRQQTNGIINLLENKSASVTIKQIN